MAVINQLPTHLANLIAAGEVVERPASVVKELVENAVDAGAKKVTVELRDGGMTFLRVTDDGCGMASEDARRAFLRHATSKIRAEEDLEAISTMGFRGEALAAIASVSRIDLLTKQSGAVAGTSLHLEGGQITDESEAGCPEGTTIIVRDLFFNTPARMKFMKQDSVEGGAAAGTVQRQALAHPEVAIRLIRDGKELLSTSGDGKLLSAMAGVYGREAGSFVSVESVWEKNRVWGYVSKPTQSRASRTWQIFFVNGRPVKSRLLQAALEEAYRNQIMVGKFPACILHLELPANRVDVNVHPAKTEVKFLSEREVFDCVHYGVLAALRKTQDRPEMRFGKQPEQSAPVSGDKEKPHLPRSDGSKETRFQTMTPEQFREFAQTIKTAPQPKAENAERTIKAIDEITVAQPVKIPGVGTPIDVTSPAKREQTGEGGFTVSHVVKGTPSVPPIKKQAEPDQVAEPAAHHPAVPVEAPREASAEVPKEVPEEDPLVEAEEQTALPMPEAVSYEILGELFRTYIVVQQADEAFLIDKHAAHERILFEKLRAQTRQIASQTLLTSQVCRLSAVAAAVVLENRELLDELGYGVEEFGQGAVILRRIPMDLDPEEAATSLEQLAQDLLTGRREDRDSLRDEMLHTVACKAAIKAGWHTDPLELEALVREVLRREDLKYCPHGRPICIKLTKAQLERQFGRT